MRPNFARRRLGVVLAAGTMVLATVAGVPGVVWRAADDPNALDLVTEAGASESATTIDPLWHIPTAQTYTPGDCGSLFTLAMDAGWTWNDWPTLSRIMWRESRCDAGQTNFRHRDRSYGLLQINTKGRLWTWPIGYGETRTLPELCGLYAREDLLDPAINLRCGRLLFELRGWAPWR